MATTCVSTNNVDNFYVSKLCQQITSTKYGRQLCRPYTRQQIMWTIPRQPFMRPHRLQNQSVSCTLRTYRGMFRFVNAHSIANRSTLHRGGYGSDQQPFDIIITYKLIITNRTQMLSVWFAIWIYGLHKSHCLQNLSVSWSLRTYRGMVRLVNAHFFANRSRIHRGGHESGRQSRTSFQHTSC